MTNELTIVKASGEREPFSEAKLRNSLERAGTPPDLVELTVSHVRGELRDDMKTADIYRRAFGFLRKHGRLSASRYSLKKAIMSLGPTGYPFEKLVGAVLRASGFSVEIGQHIRGYCVSHEVDVVAQKGERRIIVESKYHNKPGYKTDVKIALYVKARFDDIRKRIQEEDGGNGLSETWLITNTRLSLDAIRYCECTGIKAIGWDYPKNDGLQNLIETAGLHPLTSLTSLTSSQKKQLLRQGAVMCRDLTEDGRLLESIGLMGTKATRVLHEIADLCSK
ncbi:MAG: ATP cone domain-containing protein [Dehalococcoidales bacterium]